MYVKLTFQIEVDETKYPNLTKTEIKKIIKASETSGDVADYILDNSKGDLEELNYEKNSK